jgi:hypothetical protein
MLERLISQKKAINYVMSEKELVDENKTKIKQLDCDEWAFVDELVKALEPFEEATKTLSGDKYATLSLLIPIITSLTVHLKKIKRETNSHIAKTIITSLLNSLQSRFRTIEKNTIITSATLLDPRVKTTCFMDDRAKKNAIEELSNELKNVNIDENNKNLTNNIENEKENDIELNASKRTKYSLFDFLKENQEANNEDSSEYLVELDKYLKEDLSNTGDIIEWWFENKKRYPRLYILSLKYLCIPATSVASERVFSKGGEIVSAKRSCLKPKNVN